MVRIVLALLDIVMIGKKNDQEAHSFSLGSEAVLIKERSHLYGDSPCASSLVFL